MNSKIVLLFTLMGLATSCSESGGQRFRPSDVNGVDGLDSGVYETLTNVLNQETPQTILPSENTNYERTVSIKTEVAKSFTIDFNGATHLCAYSYSQASESITFTLETSTNDLGNEITEYKYQKVMTPLEPTYTSVPNIGESREACNAQISSLRELSEEKVIDFNQRWIDFKTLMKEQVTDLIDKCAVGARVNGTKCVGARLLSSTLSEDNPVDILAFEFQFTWRSDSNMESTTNLAFELAPELYYTDTYGFINLSHALPVLETSVDFNYSAIATEKLSGL